ncbi:MAG: hypothetical protein JXB36_09335 [Gammaproteobacteria bacterium]|nr:hypothetical protein [Gammaproteobacteria bacterium]
MASRRQFIQSGLALSAASLPAVSALAAQAAPGGASQTLRLERFVVDVRLPQAVELARHAAIRGIPVAETSGDLTEIWRGDFAPRWKQAPMALAGATTRGELFVLETLANDHGMRVVYRGRHDGSKRARARHRLSGPAEVLAGATARAHGFSRGFSWSALAGALAACPVGLTPTARLELETEAVAPGPAGDEPLYTWIIAPRAALTARA